MKTNAWMVRCESGLLFDDFKEQSLVAVGWPAMGNLSPLNDQEGFKKKHRAVFPDHKSRRMAAEAALLYKFTYVLGLKDGVVTYDPKSRVYLVGEVVGDYEYKESFLGEYPSIRKVKWQGEIKRDQLTLSTRNSLGSTLTLFALNAEVWAELQEKVTQKPKKKVEEVDPLDSEEFEQVKDDQIDKAYELIKDKILSLNPREMEFLAAAILRAMGYKTKVSKVGPDQGVDVFASPDGLGFEDPRIKVQVKHRPNTSISEPDLGSFLSALNSGEKGLYISTGGFTKDAKLSAKHANVAITLVDLDQLADLVIDHYENFDAEGRDLIPLVRIYWPSE